MFIFLNVNSLLIIISADAINQRVRHDKEKYIYICILLQVVFILIIASRCKVHNVLRINNKTCPSDLPCLNVKHELIEVYHSNKNSN